ncbi:MAG: sigma 54-interacting transcriptional regulator [Bradymonadales bacterium]|nr:sigma 54-interacting transcriptional regulator [Bradymonadales bacterium]
MGETVPGRKITEPTPWSVRLVIYPPGGPARAMVFDGVRLDVGRDPTCGLCLEDRRVSGCHARLRRRRDAGTLEIEDQSSTNGSFVNGRRVTSAILEEGDVVRLGDTLLVLELDPTDLGGASPVESSATRLLEGKLSLAVANKSNVLLLGPTGSGKGYYACRIAERSPWGKPLVHVNCASVHGQLFESELFGHRKGAFTGAEEDKPGLIEAAQGGTLFLDEIGAMPASLQSKLLTCLEQGEVRRVGDTRPRQLDVRFIAATNLDIDQALHKGIFRADLYYRLAAITIHLQPLARRRVDIIPLLMGALGSGDHRRFTPEALEALLTWSWPGNVRELLNLARLLPMSQEGPTDYHVLPDPLIEFLEQRADGSKERGRSFAAPPKEFLVQQLEAAGNNVSELARRLGKHRNQVVRWLDAYGLRK